MSLPNKPATTPTNTQAASTLGRPVKMSGGKSRMVYLDQSSIDVALAIGDGNISAGIRLALAAYEAAK